jgi:4-carboxymuconolactone decarboxylase
MINSGRIEPRKSEAWPKDLNSILEELGNPLNIHGLMAHHSSLMQAWMPFRNHIVANSTLEPRQRELLILRTAVNCGAAYEWSHHVVRGKEVGLSDDEIQRVKQNPETASWPDDDRALLMAADDCFHGSMVSDETYAQLKDHFSVEQQLDVLATVGMYITLATMIKTFRVPLESDHAVSSLD